MYYILKSAIIFFIIQNNKNNMDFFKLQKVI